MRITVLTIGSRGDVQPFIALAAGLKKAGYHVRLATHSNFKALAESYGLNHFPLESNVQEMSQGEAGKKMYESGKNPFTFLRRYGELLQPVLEKALIESWEACQGSDAIIAHAAAFWGYDIAQKMGVPFLLAALQPINPTGEFPNIFIQSNQNFGQLFNRLTYPLIWQFLWQPFYQPINQWRRNTLNLPSVSRWSPPWDDIGKENRPLLYGYSSTIVPKPKDWPQQTHITGYWFLDRSSDFSPPSELVDFLAAGKPPVYIGFGSMVNRNPELMTEIALKALAKTGQRGILLTGWGGISNADLPDDVFKIDAIPHDWLFPQMAAIVHHGGAGTTAAALRAGIPAVVVPFIADQSFWGDRVANLGVGTSPIPRHTLSVEKLAAGIQTTLENQEMRSRAAEIGQSIRQENGIQEAVKVCQQFFEEQSLKVSISLA